MSSFIMAMVNCYVALVYLVARRVIVGIDGNLHVSNAGRKQVYTYTPEGRQVGVTTYKEVNYADGSVNGHCR